MEGNRSAQMALLTVGDMRLWSALGVAVAASEAADESRVPETKIEGFAPMTGTPASTPTSPPNGTNAAAPKTGTAPGSSASSTIDTAAYRSLGEVVQPIARSIDKLLKEAETLEESDAVLADLGLDLKTAVVNYESHIVKRRRGKA
jgi:hypothetical protein